MGTWVHESMRKKWESNTYMQTYYKTEYIFNANGTVIYKRYESNTGTYNDPTSTDSGTYTYSNGTMTVTDMQENNGAYKISILNNKYLILGNETSPSFWAYLKQ
nr:lipocalin family protein [Gracilinema caldarium]